MLPSQYRATIERHVARYKDKGGEKEYFDKVRRVYRGEFWSSKSGPSEAQLMKMSTNLVFAITDTALSTLVPPNPQVSAIPRNRADEDRVASAEDVVNLAFDTGRFRRELGTTTFHAVLYGRGVGKTVWDSARDLPVTRSIDPRNLFFDLVATRPEDIRYWIELTLVGEREFLKRVESGQYDKAVAAEYRADTYPRWMLPDDAKEWDSQKLKNFQKWHIVYECYDMEDGKVWHFCPDADKPLFEDDLLYLPYDLLALNSNGEDCRGLSEIGLILDNQEEYNLLSTYLHNIVRYQVGRIGYDAGALVEDVVEKMHQAPLGAAVPMSMRPELRGQGHTAKDFIFELPVVHAQPEQIDLLARLREGIAYVSALADAQRGQVTGAKTATELALIEGQLRNRLRNRQTALDEFTESCASKQLLLASRFMRKEKVLRITGEEGWRSIDPWSLEGVEATFKMVPYSPMESNRAVKAEIMRSMIDVFAKNPLIDQRNFFYHLLKLLDMPADVLKKQEDVEQAAGQPGAPAGPGAPGPGAPVAPPDPNAAPLPPNVQALANAQVPGPAGAVAPGETPMGGGPATTGPG
jgi:hypothetical protein